MLPSDGLDVDCYFCGGRFELEIWDVLAEIAAEHMEKGEEIFVTGRIVVDKNVKGESMYTTVKVVVRDLCFVEPYNDQRQAYGQSNDEFMVMESSRRSSVHWR